MLSYGGARLSSVLLHDPKKWMGSLALLVPGPKFHIWDISSFALCMVHAHLYKSQPFLVAWYASLLELPSFVYCKIHISCKDEASLDPMSKDNFNFWMGLFVSYIIYCFQNLVCMIRSIPSTRQALFLYPKRTLVFGWLYLFSYIKCCFQKNAPSHPLYILVMNHLSHYKLMTTYNFIQSYPYLMPLFQFCLANEKPAHWARQLS